MARASATAQACLRVLLRVTSTLLCLLILFNGTDIGLVDGFKLLADRGNTVGKLIQFIKNNWGQSSKNNWGQSRKTLE